MTERKVWNYLEIGEKIRTNNKWLERGIVAIFEKQTADEQKCEDTVHHNGVGFSAFDAKRFSYYAKWIKSGKHLDGRHLELARKIMPKYAMQLMQIANAKEEAKYVEENKLAVDNKEPSGK